MIIGSIKRPPDIPASIHYIRLAPGPSGLLAFGPASPARARLGGARGFAMTGTARTSAGLDERQRRLLYRAWHRGTREMDLIMGRFADAAVGQLTEAEIGELERLAEVPDHELYAWLTGDRPVPDKYDHAMFRRLRDFYAKADRATDPPAEGFSLTR
jgi:antitoxin CptB